MHSVNTGTMLRRREAEADNKIMQRTINNVYLLQKKVLKIKFDPLSNIRNKMVMFLLEIFTSSKMMKS